ncbi:MAG: 50S ribosomal protein L15 [Chloroflexi bacterium CFX4]|nr:50S ribosomal protein L15 [Chloroflexi bacterium CFX4]MDL1921763.1 50S ribosomal protein L15 [Chloroflexi bacterium CFX3]
MKLHDLKPDKGAHKRKRRVGRGISAGQGKTAGRGQKGQAARTGGVKAPYFEGGQLPLVRRLPFKRGFTNLFKIYYQEVNLEAVAEAFPKGGLVTPSKLLEVGLIDNLEQPVVILGMGELAAKTDVKAHRFSKSARAKIEAAGGTASEMKLLLRGAHATIKLLPKDRRPKYEE